MRNNNRKYVGSADSTIKQIVTKIRELVREGYRDIIVEKAKYFHKPNSTIWVQKGGKSNINIQIAAESAYKTMIKNDLEAFGLSRKHETDKMERIAEAMFQQAL